MYIRCKYRLLYLLIIYIAWNLCHFDVPISTKCPRKCKGQSRGIRWLPTQIQIYCRRSKNVNINCKHMITKIRREILQCCPELVPQISGILCPVFVVIVSWSWQTPPPTSAEVSASSVVDGAFVVNCSKSSLTSQTAKNHSY